MTDIQVKYWNLQELGRHNSATEAQARNELAETGRHNLVTEAQGQQTIAENVRHNKKSEKLSSNQIAETKRHNIAGEGIAKTGNRIAAYNATVNKQQADAATLRAKADAALSAARTAAQNWQNEWRDRNPSLASLKEAGLISNEKVLTTALTSGALGIDVSKRISDKLNKGQQLDNSDLISLYERGVKQGALVKLSDKNGDVTYVAPGLMNSKGETIMTTVKRREISAAKRKGKIK